MPQNENSKSPTHGLWALTNRDLKKWYKNPILLIMTTIVQPIIWLVLFGKAFNITAIFTSTKITLPSSITSYIPPTVLPQLQTYLSSLGTQLFTGVFGVSNYFSYMAVGMLAFVTLFTCMFSGMSIVWDRRLGFLNKALSTPVSRSSIIVSKILNTVIRALVQSAVVLTVALFLGLTLGADFSPIYLIGVFGALFLLSIGLSSIFVFLAIRSTRMETQMAIFTLLSLPLLFASNALFPMSILPSWLQTVARINPISYATDAARQLLVLSPINTSALFGDFLFLAVFAAVFGGIGTLLSHRYLTR